MMHRRSKVAGSVGDLMHIYYSPSPIYLKKKKLRFSCAKFSVFQNAKYSFMIYIPGSCSTSGACRSMCGYLWVTCVFAYSVSVHSDSIMLLVS